MKLCAEDPVSPHDGRHRPVVVRHRQDVLPVIRQHVIGMDEIDITLFQAVQEGMELGKAEAVPSHVGNRKIPLQPHHAAGEEVESLMVPVLFAPGKEELHPEADPEKGFAPKSFLLDHLIEPPFRQLPHRIPEGPHAGEDDPGGLLDGFRIGGDGVRPPVTDAVDFGAEAYVLSRPVAGPREARPEHERGDARGFDDTPLDGWRRMLDTARAVPEDFMDWHEAPGVDTASYLAQPRSVVGLVARLAGYEAERFAG